MAKGVRLLIIESTQGMIGISLMVAMVVNVYIAGIVKTGQWKLPQCGLLKNVFSYVVLDRCVWSAAF